MSREKAYTPNTRVLHCACRHPFQDERYGINQRVHNAARKPRPGWRCTVCLHWKEDSL